MNTKLLDHLKHLLFNDAIMTHKMGTNHNSGDRGCVYDKFIYQIRNPRFNEFYDIIFKKYLKLRSEFESEPWGVQEVLCINGIPLTDLTEEELKAGPLPTCAEDSEWMNVPCRMGFWESLEDLDEYVNEYAEKRLNYLLLQPTPKLQDEAMFYKSMGMDKPSHYSVEVLD